MNEQSSLMGSSDKTIDYSFIELTNKIAEHVYMFSLKNKTFFSKEFPKIIGGIGFWLENKDNKVILMYTTHPKKWDKTKMIMDIENQEKLFLDQTSYSIY